MKDLTVMTLEVKTMSSLEIAELTGKKHQHVRRDIKKILDEAKIGVSRFGHTYKTSQGKELECYNLPRRECDLVVSGYSVPYRLAIIDRWHELELKNQNVLPQNFSDACRLLADKHDQLQFAIKTKAQISSKKAATAMQTAGAMSKRLTKAKNELVVSDERATISERRADILSLQLNKVSQISSLALKEQNRYTPYKSKDDYTCEKCGGIIKGGIFGMVVHLNNNGGKWGVHTHKECIGQFVRDEATRKYNLGERV